MRHQDEHLSDEVLVMAADGELDSPRLAKVRDHLAVCSECRGQMQAIERASLALVRAREMELQPSGEPRALLRSRLEAGDSMTFDWRPRAVLAAAGLLVAIGIYQWTTPGRSIAEVEAGVAPKTSLTPGATLPLTATEVCAAGFAQGPPAIPAAIQRQVFEAYGIANPKLDAYEVDYLITPELGGATSIRNLWPEPYHAPVWNAHVKDALEDRLHDMVCRGDLDLAIAQQDIAADWIAAYKKYFRTDRPLVGHLREAPELLAAVFRGPVGAP
jgi:hypothetical protein